MPDVGRVLRGVSETGTAVDATSSTLDPITTDNVEMGAALAGTWGHLGATYFASEADFGSRLVPNGDGIFQVRREPTRTSGWELADASTRPPASPSAPGSRSSMAGSTATTTAPSSRTSGPPTSARAG